MPNQKLRRRRPDATRVLAYQTLRAVSAEGAYANLELGRRLAEARLDPRDAAFATELLAGTCRLQGTYDRIIAEASGRAVGALQPDLLDALRLGAHQLLSMRVPDRAAVAATVELAASEIGEKVAGLVNAVLRKVATRDLDAWVVVLGEREDDLGRLALRTHHPRWIAEEYVRLLGDEAEDALAANNVPPIPTLVARPGLASVAELDGTPARHSGYGAYRPGNPSDVPAVREGRAGVQDEGSQLVASALALEVADTPATSLPWLDLCAGPGGKSALLAGLAIERGSRLLASEVQEHRARLVAEALRAYTRGDRPAGGVARPSSASPGAPVVVCADGTRPAWRDRAFGAVLADVPCTGLGALRRRPESRWRRTPADLDALVPLQRRLLASAIDAAADGGVVAYVTCSPHHAETVEVVESVLSGPVRPVEVLDAAPRLPNVLATGLGPFVQLWPHRHGTDAMFLALLRVGE